VQNYDTDVNGQWNIVNYNKGIFPPKFAKSSKFGGTFQKEQLKLNEKFTSYFAY